MRRFRGPGSTSGQVEVAFPYGKLAFQFGITILLLANSALRFGLSPYKPAFLASLTSLLIQA